MFEITRINPKNKDKNSPKLFFFSDFDKYPNYQNDIENLANLGKNSAVIFRQYHLSSDEKSQLVTKIKKITDSKKVKLIVGKDYRLFKKIKADGIHFSDFDFKKRIINKFLLKLKKNSRRKIIFSIACHSARSIIKAIKLKPDIIFLSPIFYTETHPEIRNIGIKKMIEIKGKTKTLNSFKTNIYPLGGINKKNIKLVSKNKLSGFGATQFFVK